MLTLSTISLQQEAYHESLTDRTAVLVVPTICDVQDPEIQKCFILSHFALLLRTLMKSTYGPNFNVYYYYYDYDYYDF